MSCNTFSPSTDFSSDIKSCILQVLWGTISFIWLLEVALSAERFTDTVYIIPHNATIIVSDMLSAINRNVFSIHYEPSIKQRKGYKSEGGSIIYLHLSSDFIHPNWKRNLL